MARQVDIEMGLAEKKMISSLEMIRDKFKELRKEKERLAPNGKMRMQIDVSSLNGSLDAIKEFKKAMLQMNSAMGKLDKTSKNFSQNGNVFNSTVNKTVNNIEKIPKGAKKADDSIKKLGASFAVTAMSLNLFRRQVTSWIRTYRELTDASFNVGVAAQLSLGNITKLNTEILNLTRNLSVSPVVFGNAVNELVRTGRTLNDSKEIMKEISKLSIASGEDLARTAQAVTKIFVSLNIEGSAKRVSEALSTIHSVAIQTASSVGGLAESYKNFAGILGVLSTSSGKSGEDLENYKQDLLSFALSSTGALNNLGLSAS